MNGAPYFSVWMLTQLIDGLGGVSEAIAAIQDFRTKVKQAGFPDLYLNAMDTGKNLPSPSPLPPFTKLPTTTNHVRQHQDGAAVYPGSLVPPIV